MVKLCLVNLYQLYLLWKPLRTLSALNRSFHSINQNEDQKQLPRHMGCISLLLEKRACRVAKLSDWMTGVITCSVLQFRLILPVIFFFQYHCLIFVFLEDRDTVNFVCSIPKHNVVYRHIGRIWFEANFRYWYLLFWPLENKSLLLSSLNVRTTNQRKLLTYGFLVED